MSELLPSSHTFAPSSTGPARAAYQAAEAALAEAREAAERVREALLVADDEAPEFAAACAADDAAEASAAAAEAALAAARDALADSDEPRTFTLRDDEGGEATIEATSMGDAIDMAADWARGGDYNAIESTIWVRVRIAGEDGTESTITVTINPDAPTCSHEDGHDWQSPIELVGGLRENPGVFGHGGGVIITTVCMHCGAGRKEDTWAQDRATGRQGLESVAYQAPGTHDVAALVEADEAADEAADDEAVAAEPTVCPWLSRPLSGTLVIEGRARFPSGYVLPDEQHGFALTWRSVGDVWHFRGEREGDPLLAAHVYSSIWFDLHPYRFDRVSYEAPAELEKGEGVDVVELDIGDDGMPVGAVISDARADLVQASESLRAVFGEALQLGTWERTPSGWRAPVTRWAP